MPSFFVLLYNYKTQTILQKKISPENFYHIYLKDRCVYNNLTKNDFETRYNEMKAMVGLMKTDYEEDDLSFEVVETLVTEEESSY